MQKTRTHVTCMNNVMWLDQNLHSTGVLKSHDTHNTHPTVHCSCTQNMLRRWWTTKITTSVCSMNAPHFCFMIGFIAQPMLHMHWGLYVCCERRGSTEHCVDGEGGQLRELPCLVTVSVSAGCFPPFKAAVMLCFAAATENKWTGVAEPLLSCILLWRSQQTQQSRVHNLDFSQTLFNPLTAVYS